MRRILFALMVSGALLTLAPATALARQHHGARDRARNQARRHARVRLERFGTATPSRRGSRGSDENGATQPGQETEQNAGRVASFENGTLTITLNDGSMVSGKVTPDTEIECQAPESSNRMQRDDEGRDHGDQGDEDGQPEANDDENAELEEAAENCSSANLQPGTAVREAELRISSAGARWKQVELITTQTGAGEDEGGES